MSTEIIASQANIEASKSVAVTAQVKTPSRQGVSAAAGNNLPADQHAGRELSAEELQNVVKQLNEHVQLVNRDLQFSVDQDSGHAVIRVVNAETKELVRQIPSEEALRISRYIKEQVNQVSGLIFHTSV